MHIFPSTKRTLLLAHPRILLFSGSFACEREKRIPSLKLYILKEYGKGNAYLVNAMQCSQWSMEETAQGGKEGGRGEAMILRMLKFRELFN